MKKGIGKAGRGYVIRFYDEKNETAIFYTGDSFKRFDTPFHLELNNALVFVNHDNAMEKVVEIKQETKKIYKKGYLYISKVFYKKGTNILRRRKSGVMTATKLTKPDRHDFLQAI